MPPFRNVDITKQLNENSNQMELIDKNFDVPLILRYNIMQIRCIISILILLFISAVLIIFLKD